MEADISELPLKQVNEILKESWMRTKASWRMSIDQNEKFKNLPKTIAEEVEIVKLASQGCPQLGKHGESIGLMVNLITLANEHLKQAEEIMNKYDAAIKEHTKGKQVGAPDEKVLEFRE